MKKLQKNYTTPEQSKRLLELGLPADSADCYHNTIAEKPFVLSMPYSQSNWMHENNPPLPCWSVGRLIEIIETCWTDSIEPPIWYNYPGKGRTIIERVLWDFENRKLDFSRLED